MKQAKPPDKLAKSFLKRHDIGMDAEGFRLYKERLQHDLSQVTNIHRLHDFWEKTTKRLHPGLAKYSRILIRQRTIELIETMDCSNPPDWFWELLDEKKYREVPHFMLPAMCVASEKVLALMEPESK